MRKRAGGGRISARRAVLTKIHYDTAQVPARDRLAYWRDAVCNSYVLLGCETGERQGFSGAIHGRRLSGLSITKVGGSQQRVTRRPRDIRRAGDDDFLLSLQAQSRGVVSQGDKAAALTPGDMVLYDSASPYQIDLQPGFEQIVLQVPRATLQARLPHVERLTGQTISGAHGVGRLLRSNLTTFATEALAGSAVAEAQPILLDLLALALAPEATPDPASANQRTMARALGLIEAHFRDPAFSRAALAAQMGLSVRRLNEVFAQHDTTIGRAIREARLTAAARDLRDGQTKRSVTQIALRNGFRSPAHFATIFSERFGETPSAFRRRA